LALGPAESGVPARSSGPLQEKPERPDRPAGRPWRVRRTGRDPPRRGGGPWTGTAETGSASVAAGRTPGGTATAAGAAPRRATARTSGRAGRPSGGNEARAARTHTRRP